ncbi:MAG: hypothetical protein LBS33_07205 [Streptococcaceae bacterium]|nr:hypothetical protein [Streptococcaceae bacterium]
MLAILDENGEIKLGKNDYETTLKLMQTVGEDFVHLATQSLPIQNGDQIVVEVELANQYLVVQLDETLNESLIFVKGNRWIYQPMLSTNGLESISENAFRSKRHYLQVRLARDYEIKQYRNLALNPHDQKDDSFAYPHAFANVETRNDATFFARNAIDGIFANQSHGSYPYQSWGINRQADAALTIDFGRPVLLDKIGLTLRADFPHDSFWTEVSVIFDHQVTKNFQTKKLSEPQYFDFEAIETTKVIITNLKKSNQDSSPFPALTEIECFGFNVFS